MLFTSLGRSELGKTVACVFVFSAALADGGTIDFGHSFSQWNLPAGEKHIFTIQLRSVEYK